MALTTQQQESWQIAFINLLGMSLSVLLSQTLLKAASEEPGTQLSKNKEVLVFLGVMFLPVLWIGTFIGWFSYLGAVSESSRNMALMYGVMAANGGAVYLLTSKQQTLQSHISAIFWPMHLGMILGSFIALVPDLAISKV